MTAFCLPEITKFARVCSYDRAGLGWSDAGYREHPGHIVADLHALLSAAGEKPPYVFASMGMGAFYTRAYQSSSTDDELVEFESRRATAAALHTEGKTLGTRPIVVLTAERGASGLSRDVQAKVAALSQNSVQRLVPSGHFIHLQEPALVVKAIADVVSAVRNRAKLSP